jgi:hypothetical protein
MFLTYQTSSAALFGGGYVTPTLDLSPAAQSRTHKQAGPAIDRLVNRQQTAIAQAWRDLQPEDIPAKPLKQFS